MSDSNKFATFDYIYGINNSSTKLKRDYLNTLITQYMWDNSNDEKNYNRYMNVTEINNTFDNLKKIHIISGQNEKRFAYNSEIIAKTPTPTKYTLTLNIYPNLDISKTNDIIYTTNIPNMSSTAQFLNKNETILTGQVEANSFYYIGFRIDESSSDFEISITNYSLNLMNVVSNLEYFDTTTQKQYKSVSFSTKDNLNSDCNISFELIN